MFTGELPRAVLETLVYSDIFEYPLRLEEVHRYLPLRADVEQVSQALQSMNGQLGEKDGFYSSRVAKRSLMFANGGKHILKNYFPFAIVVVIPASIVKYRGMQSPHKKSPNVDFDPMMIRSPDGTIRFWNKGAERLYGWQAGETVGQRSHSLLKTLFPQPLPSIEQELKTVGYWQGELIHIRRDGSRMTVWSRWELRYEGQGSVPTVVEINYPPSVA